MLKTLLLGAAGLAMALAAPGAAGAQPHMPGEAPPALTGDVVGGSGATISGGGDNMVIAYTTGGAGAGGVFEQAARPARFVGTDGDGLQVDYSAPAAAAVPGAGTGRAARLIGGGDNAQVVYSEPR